MSESIIMADELCVSQARKHIHYEQNSTDKIQVLDNITPE
ncbi:hypothetical protein yberc0001_9200 [Yersinia bercovieri ATCC 43970]|uniref:Uncharacterized protein n=1 Tax=Yersinia bercovieri ATCC 43970 TaxID=349968 RepID=A0ABP2E0F5_YERBE|nr:hypothetical protein yberc0001_9200 [Yersinia bercovieri ATCC 43970]